MSAIRDKLVLRWLIGQLLGALLAGVRRLYIQADFPRRHVYRVRFWRLVDSLDLRPFAIGEICGARIELVAASGEVES